MFKKGRKKRLPRQPKQCSLEIHSKRIYALLLYQNKSEVIQMNNINNNNFDFLGNQFITINLNDEVYFLLTQITSFLEYKNIYDALKYVDDEDVKTLTWRNSRKTRESNLWNGRDKTNKRIINEYALYDLVSHSKMPLARKFQKYITHVVIPSIRKTGMYATPQTADKLLNDPDTMIKLLENFKQSRDENQRLTLENNELKPKANLADAISRTSNLITFATLSLYVRQAGFSDMGRNTLLKYARDHGLLMKGYGKQPRNRPTSLGVKLGLFKEVAEYSYSDNGRCVYEVQTYAYQKAINYFIRRLTRERTHELTKRED